MLTDELKKHIQSAYSEFIAKKSYQSRPGQRAMIAEIARYLGNIEEDAEGARSSPHKVCVVEAGTGTGKTLAYSVSAIPFILMYGKKLIISTATTALQDQIIHKDLPDFVENSGEVFTFALAKGRGRYLCLSKLDNQLNGHDAAVDGTLPLLLEADTVTAQEDKITLELMLTRYSLSEWNGDRDQWADPILPELWAKISTDHRQCTKRHCRFYQTCSYYLARKKLEDADVIVANHDLVLSDLSLGGGVVLPAPEKSVYIFDEAHHLADKALAHFAVQGSIRSSQNALKQMTKALSELLPKSKSDNNVRSIIETVSHISKAIHLTLDTIFEQLEQGVHWSDVREQNRKIIQTYRFPMGVVDENYQKEARELMALYGSMQKKLSEISTELDKAIEEKSQPVMDKESAERWSPIVSVLSGRAEAAYQLWSFYAEADSEEATPSVRWLARHIDNESIEIYLMGSPMVADHLLYNQLWSQCFGAVLTSATLSSLGTFHRLKQSAGLPDESVFQIFSSPFNYFEAGLLVVPAMASRPNQSDEHTRELLTLIPHHLGDDLGTLVLFSSRRQMNEVISGLKEEIRDKVISQDAMSKQEVLRQHRKKIDLGESSIIFGLASFAEGIDLPGKYLTSVMIAKIPFSVPNDPLTEALSEWIESNGGRPFMEISVPDASLKLIQACGRLLRTEQDSGRITLFDNRLISQRYGRLLLGSLPPFRQELGKK